MIYVNGDSYSLSNGKNYGNYLSEIYNQPLMHKGIPGSSNNRILRTTTRDLLKLKNQNVTDVKVVIGLSFSFRTEIWIEDHGIEKWTQFEFDDGEFASFQAARNTDWWEVGPDPSQLPHIAQPYKNYLKEWIMSNPADGLVINTIYQTSLLKVVIIPHQLFFPLTEFLFHILLNLFFPFSEIDGKFFQPCLLYLLLVSFFYVA